MGKRDIKSKRAAIRLEIKERMQHALDSRKAEIKARIKRESIPVEQKREKYRREVHREKQRLMDLAKEEFIARKKMLGPAGVEEPIEESYDEPPPIPPWAHEEVDFQPSEKEPDLIQHQPQVRAEEAFVYDDEDDSDLVEFQSPIGESDAMPPAELPPDESLENERLAHEPRAGEQSAGKSARGRAGRPARIAETAGSKNLFYYILNLIPHPVVTLDEFDDYLATRGGVAKVLLFYFVSLLPVVLFAMAAEGISDYFPGGRVGNIVGAMGVQAGPLMLVGRTVFNLLFFCLIVSIVNYFATSETHFLTLTVYFAFVEGVTRAVMYTLVILAVIAAVFAIVSPQLMGLVGGIAVLLILSYFVWTIVLDIIVLMSAYGYDFISALLLAIGAVVVRFIFTKIMVAHKIGSFIFGN